MKSIIEHIALTTRILGAPVSEAALSAEVARDRKLNINFQSLGEVMVLRIPYQNVICRIFLHWQFH